MKNGFVRRITACLLCVLLTFSSFAFAEQALTPGTYTGVAQGFGGALEVSVTLDETSIVDVVVVSNSETPGIGSNAIENLPAGIVAAQSIAVDTIAGCTVSCNAILEAVEQALVAAGADVALFSHAPVAAEPVAAEQIALATDVVVVGAGGAGIITALAAAEDGLNVILLEKMSYIGGSTAACGGGILAGYSGEQSNPDGMFVELMKKGHFENDGAMAWLYASNSSSTIDWLKEHQVELTGPDDSSTDAHAHYSAVGTGLALVNTLNERIAENENISLMLSTKATELMVENGRVCGVVAEAEGVQYTISAEAVVLASGGYANNAGLVGDAAGNAVNYGPASSTGDGHLMAVEVGAQLVDTDWIVVKPNGIDLGDGQGKYTQPANKQLWAKTGSISVNLDGVRVTDENAGESALNKVYLEQEDESLYTVMDQEAFALFCKLGPERHLFTDSNIEAWLDSGSNTPLLVSGATLEEVAAKAGINGAALVETVARYNEMVGKGADEDFGRAVSIPMGDGPYYILKQNLRFSQTLGGIVANENLEIVDAQGEAIPGLYGAGELVTGASGDTVFSLLGWALTSGWYLGTHLAGYLN